MEIVYALAIGMLAGCRRVAAASPTHLSGAAGADAALLRDQSLYLRHGPARPASGRPIIDPAPGPSIPRSTPTRYRRRWY